MMEIEKEMEVQDSHILAKQKTKEKEILLDYDYKKCAGCSICVALCPKLALQEGPLQEIAKGLDAPPVLIDLDACAFCGMFKDVPLQVLPLEEVLRGMEADAREMGRFLPLITSLYLEGGDPLALPALFTQ